ncbi:MAG TPA: HEAT repeat domain-containing protein [Phycisphaerae bacterium]|nr:HEAT repeat domain-containing protein [Phycisphaerae bacterium]
MPQVFRPRRRWPWLLVLIFPLAAGTVSATHSGFAVAFFLSRPFLSQLVSKADRDYPILDWPASSAGLLPCDAVFSNRDSIFIVLSPDVALVHSKSGNITPDWFTAGIPLPYADGKWFLLHYPQDLKDLHHFARYEILEDLKAHPDASARAMKVLLDSLKLPADETGYRPMPDGQFVAEPGAYNAARLFDDPNEKPREIRPEWPNVPIRLDLQLISRIGAPAVPAIVAELDAHRSSARMLIAALGLIGKPAAGTAPRVAAFLKDPDPWTRATAAWTLRAIDSPECTQSQALLEALGDADVTVCFNALLALEASHVDVERLIPAYAAHWNRGATALYRNSIADGRFPSLRAEAPLLLMIEMRIRHAGPAAAAATGEMADFLNNLAGFYASQKGTWERFIGLGHGVTTFYDLDISEAAAARMLAAIGPGAKSAAPAVVALLRYRLRPGGEGGTERFYLLLEALRGMAPLPAETTAALAKTCEAGLLDARIAATTPQGAEAAALRSDVTACARTLRLVDPENAALRGRLAVDLQLPVEDPARMWAVEVAAEFAPEMAVRPIRAMVEHGEAATVDGALKAARDLSIPELLPALRARMAANAALTPTVLENAVYRMLKYDLQNPETRVFLLQQARKNSEAYQHLQTGRFVVDWPYPHIEAHPVCATLVPWNEAETDHPLDGLLEHLHAYPPPARVMEQLRQAPDRKMQEQLIYRLADSIDSHPGADVRPVRDILETMALPVPAPPRPMFVSSSEPSTAVQRLLVRIPWDARQKTFFETNLAAIHFRYVEEFHPTAIPWLLEAMARQTGGTREEMAEAFFQLARTNPQPVDVINQTIPFMRADRFGASDVRAIAVASGSDTLKLQLLSALIDMSQACGCHLAAIEAVLATPSTTLPPELRPALENAAYGSPDESVRAAARNALAKLYPNP